MDDMRRSIEETEKKFDIMAKKIEHFAKKNKELERKNRELEKRTGNTFNTINNTLITVNNYTAPNIDGLVVSMADFKGLPISLGLIKVIHFNPDRPENKSIILKNKKEESCAAYVNKKWVLVDKNDLRIDVSNTVQTYGARLLNEGMGPGSKSAFSKLCPGDRNRVISFNSGKDEAQLPLKDLMRLMYNNRE
jgi:hypothetical protein